MGDVGRGLAETVAGMPLHSTRHPPFPPGAAPSRCTTPDASEMRVSRRRSARHWRHLVFQHFIGRFTETCICGHQLGVLEPRGAEMCRKVGQERAKTTVS